MNSLGSRLALWYATAATATLAVLLVAAYYLLERQLFRGVDLLISAEFNELKAHLGADYGTRSAQAIDASIRQTTEYASVLFFITIDARSHGGNTLFASSNLHGRSIPDVPGERTFNVELPGVGEVRAAEFILGPYDVTVATPLKPVREVMGGYVRICLWLMALMIAISTAIGVLLSRLALRPVRLIRETANRIRADNLGERIPVASVRDEISDLARLLNQMFDRLESAFDQIRRFTAEASHELKTPLSLLRLQAEKLLLQGGLDAGGEEAVHQQLEEIGRLNQIIDDLLFLSRAEARKIVLPMQLADPQDLLRPFAQDARLLAEERGREFTCEHAGEGLIAYAPAWLRRVLLNLLSNALAASPPGGRIQLSSRLDARSWLLAMTDEGSGVPEPDRERIFERFVRLPTAEAAGGGTGLGLTICRSIVALHRGWIRAEAGPGGRGLRVVLEIPRTADQLRE